MSWAGSLLETGYPLQSLDAEYVREVFEIALEHVSLYQRVDLALHTRYLLSYAHLPGHGGAHLLDLFGRDVAPPRVAEHVLLCDLLCISLIRFDGWLRLRRCDHVDLVPIGE